MKEYDVVISTKGQFVLPKEIREKFKLSTGSKIKVLVDGEQITLRLRTVADELQDLIFTDIAKTGKKISGEIVKEYQVKLNQAIDKIVAEADQEYGNKEYVSLNDLRE